MRGACAPPGDFGCVERSILEVTCEQNTVFWKHGIHVGVLDITVLLKPRNGNLAFQDADESEPVSASLREATGFPAGRRML